MVEEYCAARVVAVGELSAARVDYEVYRYPLVGDARILRGVENGNVFGNYRSIIVSIIVSEILCVGGEGVDFGSAFSLYHIIILAAGYFVNLVAVLIYEEVVCNLAVCVVISFGL